MISDIVCEQLIKKKFGPKQAVQGGAIVVVGGLLSYVLWAIGEVADRTVHLLGLLFLASGWAATVYFLRFVLMVEYEYTFVNGELTIDKIMAKSKRKHIANITVRGFEKIGKFDPNVVNNIKADIECDYSTSKDDENTLYALYRDEKTGRKTLLFFTPNEKIILAMKSYVNASVFREAFPNLRNAAKPQVTSLPYTPVTNVLDEDDDEVEEAIEEKVADEPVVEESAKEPVKAEEAEEEKVEEEKTAEKFPESTTKKSANSAAKSTSNGGAKKSANSAAKGTSNGGTKKSANSAAKSASNGTSKGK